MDEAFQLIDFNIGQLILLFKTSPITPFWYLYAFFVWENSISLEKEPYSSAGGLYVWLLASWRLLRDNNWIYLEKIT